MNFGYIKLHRQIRDNILFQEKRIFSKFEAWIDILLSCNFTAGEFLLGYEIYKVDIGSFVTSKAKLRTKYGWGANKLNNFLGLLISLGMIRQKTIGRGNQKATQLFVLNYRKYQVDELKANLKIKSKQSLSEKQYKKDKNNISIDILEETSNKEFGNKKINELQKIIKGEISKRGLIYENTTQERARLNNVLNGKRINKIAFEKGFNIFEFITYIFELTDISEFWNGKITSGETFYRFYPKVLNEYKINKKNLFGVYDIESFLKDYNLSKPQKEKLESICQIRKLNKQKINKEILKNVIHGILNENYL